MPKRRLRRALLCWHRAMSCGAGVKQGWGSPVDQCDPLVRGGTLLRRAAGSLLTRTSPSRGCTVLPKGARGLGEDGLGCSGCFLGICFPMNEGGMSSIQSCCGLYFKGRVEELHVSEFPNAKGYLKPIIVKTVVKATLLSEMNNTTRFLRGAYVSD